MRLILILVACALVAACGTTSNIKSAAAVSKPPAGARVLIVKPDIELSVLGIAGISEPKADWNLAAVSNITGQIESTLRNRDHTFAAFDPVEAMGGRGGQVLRLNEAVGNSIMAIDYGPYKMPTKKGSFEWTLGDGALAFGTANNADYALFIVGRGTYASGARVAAAVGMSLLGVGMPLGHQQAFASLVDLKTGKVVWFNMSVAGSNDDMREVDGAQRLVTALLKDVPL